MASPRRAGPTVVEKPAQAVVNPSHRKVCAETCNALITEAPLQQIELEALRTHFLALSDLCGMSGPRFSAPRRDAIDMHNRVVRRLRGIRDEARRRATMQEDDELLELR
jgi:hypothetical protein